LKSEDPELAPSAEPLGEAGRVGRDRLCAVEQRISTITAVLL